VIQDITCDSDGRIDRYVDGQGIETTLPLPADVPGEPMLMGFFMTGAYQEILGDMHNLFGDTHSVDVRSNAGGGYTISDPIRGDTVAKVLQYVNFEPADLTAAYERKFSTSELDQNTRATLLAELTGGLNGYTYLEE
jgi:arginine decarboxylase